MFNENYVEENFKIVLIRSPYEIMHFPLVSEMFPKIIQLKTSGYRLEYGSLFLPFDVSDFVASHLLLCEKMVTGELRPVLGFKSVTLKKCDDHRINFPILNFLDAPHPENAYQKTIKSILNQYRERGLEDRIAYNGSFTVSPDLRENKALMKHFWDITFSLLTNYYIEYNIEHVIAICATKFKIHDKKEKLGWNYISGEYGTLESYNCKAFFGANLVPMELTDLRSKSALPSSKFKAMWEHKIVLDLEHAEDAKKKAA